MAFGISLLLCASVVVAGVAAAARAPHASGRTLVLAALGLFFGALIGAAPGGIMFVGAAVVASTGPGGATSWTGLTLFFLGGLLLGGAAGAVALVRLSDDRPKGLGRAALYAVLGGSFACASACGALALAGAHRAADLIVYLAPFMMLSASLGAFARGLRAS